MADDDALDVHRRCGRPWAEHTEARFHGFLDVPLCEDEVVRLEAGQYPIAPPDRSRESED